MPNARRCLYFELGLPVMKLSAIKEKAIFLDRRLTGYLSIKNTSDLTLEVFGSGK